MSDELKNRLLSCTWQVVNYDGGATSLAVQGDDDFEKSQLLLSSRFFPKDVQLVRFDNLEIVPIINKCDQMNEAMSSRKFYLPSVGEDAHIFEQVTTCGHELIQWNENKSKFKQKYEEFGKLVQIQAKIRDEIPHPPIVNNKMKFPEPHIWRLQCNNNMHKWYAIYSRITNNFINVNGLAYLPISMVDETSLFNDDIKEYDIFIHGYTVVN